MKRLYATVASLILFVSCTTRPPDGLWTEYYDNGNKKVEGTIKDGKDEGVWTTWHENGQKENEGTYMDSKQVGKWTYYNEDGSIKEVKDFGGE